MSKYGCKITATMTPISNENIEKLGIKTIEENYAQIHDFKHYYLIKISKYYMGWMIHRDDSIESPILIWIPTNVMLMEI